ncbi:hypothetical protein KMW28_03880 [Flammeovirga yaeyamensis]|uniref:Uncharacterized protein n=1 Tax=Flammeovirga yaeyamensis TaxID=367791 RepID=A0AAX1N5G0_9BACT|nr:hypothetical protein [Flammeovirga yaeyamensis]MBB3701489.1 hypothetical protein [Flammeovirga yaeyamensis]NMF38612.1 hypothetical protein [Flammeovirga yaeyamensis]QWG02725.1 hypothetical protein KMW28_03880 [Flammeovirga yaeyamensis]
MKKKSYKIDPKYLKEFFSVLFGVMFALFIDTLWSDHEHQQLAEKASHDILTEIEENQIKIDSLIIDHQKTKELISEVLKELKEEKKDSVPKEKDVILSFRLIEDTAWETAKISGAVTYMELDQLSKFNGLYKMQMIHMHNMEKFMEHSFTGMQLLSQEEKLSQMSYFIQSAIATEQQLQERYKEILNDYKVSK